jgi:hypothetical protein
MEYKVDKLKVQANRRADEEMLPMYDARLMEDKINELTSVLKEAEAIFNGELGQDWADKFGPFHKMLEKSKEPWE